MTRAELDAVIDVDGVEVEHVDKVDGGERWFLSFRMPAGGHPVLDALLKRPDVADYAGEGDHHCVRFLVKAGGAP